ncbi:chromosome partitioning protein ParA (plasmid) [Haloarcula taiwanensis]|uniref:Chromosome partitioning protein ParA n=1 Tax=Haloarcula taiwanensis TaxID=1932004 RepID=A0A2H5A492_9EURY|nr:ParA family protein [Haloarcula taiwanensis]AUG49562.1 chromosome partitioning protein ParA [Haloarcula taiwanensis]
MLAYTTYSEAGGVGKTTTAANLAHAHAQNGLKTLVIDLDPQEASISYIFGVDDDRDDGAADNLVRHMVGRGKGSFADLIREDTGVENLDVIPAHNMLSSLDTTMRRAKETEEQMNPDAEWVEEEQLYQLLGRNGIHEQYDAIICDPQASEGQGLYNAVMVTQTVLIPVELSGKGSLSIDGLEQLVDGLEDNLDIEVGVLGIVPVAFGDTTGQQQHLATLEEDIDYEVPAVFRKRESLMQEMWDARATAYQVVEEAYKDGEKGVRRVPDREHATLEKYDDLAAEIEAVFDA